MTMTKQNNRDYNRDIKEQRIKAAQELTRICKKEFLEANPNFYENFSKLKPTNPVSLANVNISQKEMAQVDLDPVVCSVICGTAMGDSSLTLPKSYQNARLQYRHSTRQTEWFMWKTLGPLKEFIGDNTIQFQAPDGNQIKTQPLGGETLGKWKVATCVSPKLTQLQRIIAPDNTRKVQRSWLNHMNNYFLMTLWLDDGSISTHNPQAFISCNNFSLEQATILADYITNVWGAQCSPKQYKSRQTETNPESPQIQFKDVESIMVFLRIVAPIVPVKSMLYKVCLNPLDTSLQQRWTSELKTLVRQEWHDTIDKYYAYLSIIKPTSQQQ